MRPTAYLIHGYICSGKTTFAKYLEIECKAIRFSIDEWINSFYGANPSREQIDNCYLSVEKLIWSYVKSTLSHGVNVVIDIGFWTKRSRSLAIKRLEKMNAKVFLYHIYCNEYEIKNRLKNRNMRVPSDSLKINEHTYKKMKELYEPLDKDEQHITVDQKYNVIEKNI